MLTIFSVFHFIEISRQKRLVYSTSKKHRSLLALRPFFVVLPEFRLQMDEQNLEKFYEKQTNGAHLKPLNEN